MFDSEIDTFFGVPGKASTLKTNRIGERKNENGGKVLLHWHPHARDSCLETISKTSWPS